MNDRWNVDPLVEEMLQAATDGDRDRVIAILDSGVDVNAGNPINITALMQAVTWGHDDLVRELLDRGADMNVANSKCHTALTYALIISRTWGASWIVEEPNPRPLQILLEAGGRYRLYEAVLLNDVELARQRLDEGADPNTGDFSYHGPLLKIAAELGHLAIVDLLLDRGANIEATDDLGQRPLTSAAHLGRVEVVKQFVRRGAAINAVDWCDQNAVSRARRAGHRELVGWLLEQGAEWGVIDALMLGDVPLFLTLLDEKIRIRSQDARPADEELDEDDPSTKYIRTSAADWIQDEGVRLAMLAASHGNAEIMAILLDRGAVHHLDYLDEHPLLAEAARHGRLGMARFLIDRGAELHAVGKDGLTPLEWAIREGHGNVADFLRRAGAIR